MILEENDEPLIVDNGQGSELEIRNIGGQLKILKETGEPVVFDSGQGSVLEIRNIGGKLKVSGVKNPAHNAPTTVKAYLDSLPEEYGSKANILALYEHWKDRFEEMPAGAKMHHIYPGGLSKHTAQVIDTALHLYEFRKGELASIISRTDIIVAGFLHDLSKVEAYRRLRNPEEIKNNGGREFTYSNEIKILDMETWILHQCLEFGVKLTKEQINAIFFAEGGFSKWGQSPRHPDWTPLAVLISAADLYSACALKK